MLAARLVTLAALVAFTVFLRSVSHEFGLLVDFGARDATLALGFLLIAAYLAGASSRSVGLPKITGYLLLGLLVGPEVLRLITSENVADLRLLDDIAISLIALSAGGELRVSELRARGRAMTGIMIAEMVMVFVIVAGAVLLLAGWLPFTAGRDPGTTATIALVFGSIAIANSPTVAIAVINETRSRGPVTSTILGVTILKDVLVIVFFAVAMAVARAVLSGGGGLDTAYLLDVGWEVVGSIVAGAIIGWLISIYLRVTRVHMALFALAAAFINAELSALLHLEVLLVSLTAGFFVENISRVHGEPFVQGIGRSSLPIYALFFALAGARIHLGDLARLWHFALGFVVLRAGAIFAGTWLGAHLSGAEPEVRRYAWVGFISQAGVTLGMVLIAARAFPEWGTSIRTLFLAMVGIHELIGPVLLQQGLLRSGEAGARDEAEAEEEPARVQVPVAEPA